MGAGLVRKNHPHLEIMGATVRVLYAVERDGAGIVHPCLKDGKRPVLGIAAVVPFRWRAHGCADAEIRLDLARWRERADRPRRQLALLDHELRHLNLALDPDGHPQWDALGRPMLRLREHDFEIGYFAETAYLFGEDSPEVEYARALDDEAGQYFTPHIRGQAQRHLRPPYWDEVRLAELRAAVKREMDRRHNVVDAAAWFRVRAEDDTEPKPKRRKARPVDITTEPEETRR
jgi:hypothetical protein